MFSFFCILYFDLCRGLCVFLIFCVQIFLLVFCVFFDFLFLWFCGFVVFYSVFLLFLVFFACLLFCVFSMIYINQQLI